MWTELTDAMQREINMALDGGPPMQVLAEGFRLQLTRADLATLRGLNWLNDEVGGREFDWILRFNTLQGQWSS